MTSLYTNMFIRLITYLRGPFLHENSAYRKNIVYHDVADGKCHALDTKKISLDPSYGA